MPTSGGGDSLFTRLRKAQVACENIGKKFLPLDIIEREITEDNVRSALSKDSSVLNAALKWLHIVPEDQLPRRVVEKAKRVFAILVNIGEPDAIRTLLADGLTDEHLPLREDGNTVTSPSGQVFRSFSTSLSEQRITDFCERQWIVLAPSLDASGRHTVLDEDCPLPFESAEERGGSHNSVVYKSKLHPAHYRGPALLNEMGFVAIKEIRNDETFEQELKNLELTATLNHKHLIKHLAAFTQVHKHYIIFPWADGGSLGDFWVHQDGGPKDTGLIIWCLRQMLRVAGAVEALHGRNVRHGDMKPENILHFTGPDHGDLIVADVGVSRKHNAATMLRQGGTKTRATTPSYEAPEAFTHKFTPRARRYDIWSIGCIFLEFALWILHDMKTIDSFHHARKDAPSCEFYLLNSDSSTSCRRAKLHPVVTRAFGLLRQDSRCRDGTIFEAFLNLIEERLLRVEVDQRAEATELVEELEKIVQEAEANPQRLFNAVASPPDKLRFPERTQTGDFEPVNGLTPEQPAE